MLAHSRSAQVPLPDPNRAHAGTLYLFAGLRYARDDGLRHGGESIEVTPTESRVLEALLAAGGRVVSKDELVARAWYGSATADHSISRAVYRVRSALRRACADPIIRTVHGVGYRVTCRVEIRAACPEADTVAADSPALQCLMRARDLLRGVGGASAGSALDELEAALRLLGRAAADDGRSAPPGLRIIC